MAKKLLKVYYWNGGISEAEKEGIRGSFNFGSGLNILDDPNILTVLPEPVKVSGSTVTDLVKWAVDGSPHDTNRYFYDAAGNVYRETSAGVWSLLKAVTNSNGQGLFIHDDYLYYVQNTQLGRYGPLSGSPSFTDNHRTSLTDTSLGKFAPGMAFGAGYVVGHGNKVGWYDGSTWTLAKLTFPPGLQVRTIDRIDEFIVFGTWRGTAITDSEEGYLFFWDGVSTTYNYFMPIEEGAINALLNSRNRTLSVIGSIGGLYLNHAPFDKIHQIPNVSLKKYVEIYPGAVTNWKGLAHIGVAGNTDSTDVIQGVYSWGSKSAKYPEALNFAFPISTGTTTGTTLKIGAVKGIGSELYIGWRDGANYGVDKVTASNDPIASAYWESLIVDDARAGEEKKALKVRVIHKALVAGQTISIDYKINRSSSYTSGASNTTENADETQTTLTIPDEDSRFYEFQWKVTLASTGATAPEVIATEFYYDDLAEEEIY